MFLKNLVEPTQPKSRGSLLSRKQFVFILQAKAWRFLCEGLKNSIIYYHNNISSLMLCQCRFHPTCSQYTLMAMDDKGIVVGLLKGIWRIMRCNPFCHGGYDPYR